MKTINGAEIAAAFTSKWAFNVRKRFALCLMFLAVTFILQPNADARNPGNRDPVWKPGTESPDRHNSMLGIATAHFTPVLLPNMDH